MSDTKLTPYAANSMANSIARAYERGYELGLSEGISPVIEELKNLSAYSEPARNALEIVEAVLKILGMEK